MFDAQKLEKLISSPCSIRYYEELESTNSTAKEFALNGEDERLIVMASAQSKGKGRKGRRFFSPDGTGAYISLLLRPKISADKALYITAAAAVSVCKAIETVCGISPKIKWVNDVLIDGKKICGILTEGAFTPSGQLEYAILGIGINFFEPIGGFPEEIREVAGAVFNEKCAEDQSYQLIANIIDRFFEYYSELEKKHFYEEYVNRSLLIGKNVKIIGAGCEKNAIAIGIDEEFHLLVRLPDGRQESLSSGEVSAKLT